MAPQDKQKNEQVAQRELADCLSMLESSAKLYDEGKVYEAARIAACIYSIFVDQNRKSSALLRRGNFTIPKMWDTAHPINPKNLLPSISLVTIRIGGDESNKRMPYIACLADRPFEPQIIAFPHWWEQTVIFRPNPKFSASRKNLVTMFRHQLGGGHFSNALDEQAHTLKYGNPAGFTFGDGSEAGYQNSAPNTLRLDRFVLKSSSLSPKFERNWKQMLPSSSLLASASHSPAPSCFRSSADHTPP